MNFKKTISLVLAVISVLLITAAAARLITWKLFWIIILLIGGFSYYIMPKMSD